ncbi:MAG: hypothetical protein SWH54_14870 [Thermodesulfobacteriota bacterium]|nr:hypothetical protein [Thermodesulfobacteriota bacterium]
MDIDGVVYTNSTLLPGASKFVERLTQGKYKFLFLTSNSYYTPCEFRDRLLEMGINVPENCFYISVMVTANFLKVPRPHSCSAYVMEARAF